MSPFDRASRYVAKMPEAVSGQNGHTQTFKVALVLLHGFKLSLHDALTVLRQYNQRCMPPWSDKELKHKLVSAHKTQPNTKLFTSHF